MKKLIIPITLGVAMTFAACGGEEEAEEEGAENTEKKEEVKEPVVLTLEVDTAESYIWWHGWMANEPEEHFHKGKVKIESGTVTLTDGVVTGGELKVDIASIYDTDLTGTEGEMHLANHLALSQRPDFFAQDSLGMPTFSISSYEDGMLKGSLTIRGNSKDVEVPVNVSVDGESVTATSENFKMDMSGFGMPGFEAPSEEEAGDHDHVMSTDVELKVNVVAK